jgi:DNA replication and repair protein RecF
LAADIEKLVCKNFRSYRTLALNISSKFVVFYGKNGAGKTNILEAISLFSSGRGLRRSTISDLNAVGSQPLSWNVELVVEKSHCKTFLSTCVQNGRRIAKIDGALASTLSKFEEIIWLLWIVPAMNNIFITSVSDRRSFFDHLVGGYDRKHKSNLKKLSDLQRERLHVIFHRKDESWLRILEEKIAEKNIEATKSRLQFIEELHKTFGEHPSDFLRPNVAVSGVIEKIYATCSEEDALLEIAGILKNSRYEDCQKQTTGISVQKSFWQANHRENHMDAAHCSTGEQKAFIISLILCAVRIYQKNRCGIPILLLDDLMVHLDKSRRNSLIKELISLDVQTFFTGTDAFLFEDMANLAQIYHLKDSICCVKQFCDSSI